jgi:hypothetical protein
MSNIYSTPRRSSQLHILGFSNGSSDYRVLLITRVAGEGIIVGIYQDAKSFWHLMPQRAALFGQRIDNRDASKRDSDDAHN